MVNRCGRRESGLVILSFLLLTLSIASYVILRGLNVGARRSAAEIHATQQALMQAKAAVIGYAVSYADGTHAVTKGPGHLPCPDRVGGNDYGVAESSGCSQASAAETGLLPFRTLGLNALVDGSGAALWYAVSDNHRAPAAPPLNSATAGTLRADGSAEEVVAVIIAPGTALSGQNRSDATRYIAAEYLEGANASVGDGSFASFAVGEFNDVVIKITRRELVSAIEKVVLGEVSRALDAYFSDPDADDDAAGADPDCPVVLPNPDNAARARDEHCDNGYPWLADINDSTYSGQVLLVTDPLFGRLPLTRHGQAFNANFLANWQVTNAASVYAVINGANPPSEDCLRNSDCTESFTVVGGTAPQQPAPAGMHGQPSAGWTQGTCILGDPAVLTGPFKITCVAAVDFTASGGVPSATWSLRREYQLEFTSNTKIAPPTAGAVRTLGVNVIDDWIGASATITIADYDMSAPPPALRGTATLTVAKLSAGDLVALDGVPFGLEVSHDDSIDHAISPGELPQWFDSNNWAELVFAHYAWAETPGNLDAECSTDSDPLSNPDCLTLDITRPGSSATTADGSARGVLLSAGARLAGQTNPLLGRPYYFELGNATNGTFTLDHREGSSTFNDQIVVLDPPDN